LTIKTRDTRRITAAEMKYMRRTAGYIWTDYKRNTQIAKEL
jgi:ABC-type ATPase involved in cell division